MELSESTLQKLKFLREHGFDAIDDLDLQYVLQRFENLAMYGSGYTIEYKLDTENIQKLMLNDICDFKQIVDKLKNLRTLKNSRTSSGVSCLIFLLDNQERLFEKLYECNKITTEDLKHLFNQIYEQGLLAICSSFLLKLFCENIPFQEIAEKYKKRDQTELLISVCSRFQDVLNLDTIKVSWLLNNIEKLDEIRALCESMELTRYLLTNFLFDNENLNKFNSTIVRSRKLKNCDVRNIFDFIELNATHYWDTYNDDWKKKEEKDIDKELLKLNELNRFVHSFKLNKDQKLELIEVLKDNEVARSRLKDIVENHLESDYEFDSLMSYLKKPEKKNLLNI